MLWLIVKGWKKIPCKLHPRESKIVYIYIKKIRFDIKECCDREDSFKYKRIKSSWKQNVMIRNTCEPVSQTTKSKSKLAELRGDPESHNTVVECYSLLSVTTIKLTWTLEVWDLEGRYGIQTLSNSITYIFLKNTERISPINLLFVQVKKITIKLNSEVIQILFSRQSETKL